MTGGLTNLFNLIHHRILITIDENPVDDLNMAGGFPLQPEFVPRPAPIMGLAGFEGHFPGGFIDIGQHQDFMGVMILSDCRQHAIGCFVKIECYHRFSSFIRTI